MAGFVLDASVAISWCFPIDPTENTPYSRSILEHVQRIDAFVPEIWPFEIANGIFVALSRRKRIIESDIYEYIQLLESLPIRVVRGEWFRNIALESLARNTISPSTMLPISTWRSAKIFRWLLQTRP